MQSLSTLAKTMRRGPAFGSIFLLNNVYYFRKCVMDPRNAALGKYLSKPTKEVLISNFRTAKAAYFDANFTPLMQALTDDPKEKAGKQATKEKFTKFYDLLEEVVERHKVAKLLADDDEGRDAIGEDIVKLLVPNLQRFTQKHKEKEFSKSTFLVRRMIVPSLIFLDLSSRPAEMYIPSNRPSVDEAY